MKIKEIEIKKSENGNDRVISGWLKTAKVKDALKNKGNNPTYWICSHKKKPVGLVLSAPLSEGCPDPLVPWVEGELQTLWIDLLLMEKNPHATELLKEFAASQGKEVGALLADPEVTNAELLSAYEEAGFAKVGTYVKGNGFFKGSPHYIMKLKLKS
jgi:hypothetical protein